VVVGHEPPSVYAKHLPGFLRPLYHGYERAVFTRAALRVVHTETHARELRALGVAGSIEVIPIPVYGPTPEAPPPEGRSHWGYYGMISPKKGLDLLLEAYQRKPPGHFPPLRMLGGAAPGNEDYVMSLEAKVRPEHQGHITFAGYIEDARLPHEFARLSLVILPYRWVSQSAALAQTCLHRIPYLASDLSYFADFHKRHDCGRLFPAGSVEGLARAMEDVLKNPLHGNALHFDALIRELSLSHCADRLLSHISWTSD
jgi:glycosyltransferase involved in cell wall biosynthesis